MKWKEKNLMTDMLKADERSNRACMDAPEVPLLLPLLHGFFCVVILKRQ